MKITDKIDIPENIPENIKKEIMRLAKKNKGKIPKEETILTEEKLDSLLDEELQKEKVA